jgi:predicted dehydrogenase
VSRLKLGIVGLGQIARDQHVPSIAAGEDFELVACASRNARLDGADNFPDLASMLAGRPDLDAIAICTPPQVHYDAARLALSQGKHVLLEKPPCATISQLAALATLAEAAKRTLFQPWHSRFAGAVAPAREWLSGKQITGARITWKEDVRHWHPGQTWIWRAGGFGVFDPGINALSILTEILAPPVFVSEAALYTPSNCEAPIAAELALVTGDGAPISAEFDFRQTGPQSWDIEINTSAGALILSTGGAELSIEGAPVAGLHGDVEYPGLYRRFAELIAAGASEVDARPFQLVADAFLVGRQVSVEPFVE